ncbi:hypothetical protein C8F04DRAFT_1202793 [Mycena alexandri]|uniref:Uncharacterized protein n=1 Tax=Mycena alexandri TaxID=1745969 RepID=A0AAD6RWS2_9AGAR|nr:hypothetical protein C8F04DRAFT_1202793 [Mycena alexandri]
MPVFFRCSRFSVTAAEINSAGGSIHHIRSPAQVNFYYGAATNAPRHNDPPPPSRPSRPTHDRTNRGAFMCSTNFSVNSSRINDCGGDLDCMYSPTRLFMHEPSSNGRYYAAGAYDDGYGNVHNNSHSGQSMDCDEIRGHDQRPPATHNYDGAQAIILPVADTYRRGSTSRHYPARDHRGRTIMLNIVGHLPIPSSDGATLKNPAMDLTIPMLDTAADIQGARMSVELHMSVPETITLWNDPPSHQSLEGNQEIDSKNPTVFVETLKNTDSEDGREREEIEDKSRMQ